MYDPVTARFLQADTYLGNQADPLSLNLYTYCLNNPERYIDPSGHFALELAAILVTAVVLGMTIDIAIQKFVEQKVCIDLDRTITEGLFSGLIGLITFGGGLAVNTVGRTAASGIKAAGTVRTIASALISSAVFGATAEAAQDMAHQYLIEGKTFAQIDYRRVGISAALGAVISTGSTMVGAGINHLRAVRTGAHTTQLVGDVVQGGKVSIDYHAVNREYTESGMRIALTKEIRNYKKMMKSQGIDVVTDTKGKRLPEGMAAGFDYTTGEVVIRKNPTLLSLHHEGLHAKQWLEIGKEKYMKIGRLAREEYVYQNLVESGMLNDVELAHSEWYIRKVRNAEGGW